MTWNYRIIHHDSQKHPYFAVHEVFYNEHGDITNWTTEPINITGESRQEVIATIKQMLADTETEALAESQLEKTLHGIL